MMLMGEVNNAIILTGNNGSANQMQHDMNVGPVSSLPRMYLYEAVV